ncbi:ABC transporter substrate-binding protein [Shimia sp. R10_1]|uniref:ABC transporter substrate-binding protein n=1 Tax=Shimia sp. R10_1 TaxID=2821095 RepID=UPI0032AE850D
MRTVFSIALAIGLFSTQLLAAGAFPVEISHKYGTARIEAAPQKVVSLSFIGHDFLLALGTVPYALRMWYGSHPYGVWPWAQEALGDGQPIVMRGEIDIEQIAAMKPDLIVGQWSGMTASDYALLSQIAPTIAPKEAWGDYGAPWAGMLRTLGRALGRSEDAEAQIDRIERRFSDIRAAHPKWQGATAAVVWSGTTGAYTADDIRMQFMAQLGFRAPPALNDIGAFDAIYKVIPEEVTDPIDADALLWIDAGSNVDRLNRLPLRHTMRAYQEGREIYVGLELAAAFSHSSPLSINYTLDHLVPLLEAAMDGDPATEVSTSRAAGILPGEVK